MLCGGRRGTTGTVGRAAVAGGAHSVCSRKEELCPTADVRVPATAPCWVAVRGEGGELAGEVGVSGGGWKAAAPCWVAVLCEGCEGDLTTGEVRDSEGLSKSRCNFASTCMARKVARDSELLGLDEEASMSTSALELELESEVVEI